VSTPTVTITIAGHPATSMALPDADTLAESLHMLYVQAVKGEQRQQWVIFPPALTELGIPADQVKAEKPVLQLHRLQTFKGNRAKWFHTKVYPATPGLPQELAAAVNDGWVVSGVTVIPLESDDYKAAWSGDTPHKALRAVDRAIFKAHNLSVK
jgi:hypothetical protein